MSVGTTTATQNAASKVVDDGEQSLGSAAKDGLTPSSLTDDEKMKVWYPRWRLYHTYAAACISVLVALASSVSKIIFTSISQNTEMVLLIGCVGLLGIPHGASDHVVIANTLHTHCGRLWLPVFLVVYLGLVAAVLYFWYLVPCIALFTFIAVSAIHFGLGDVDKAMTGSSIMYALEVPTRGFMIMVLPCVHHTHNVDRIWTWLVGNEEQNRSVQEALEWMHMLMPIWYVCICLIVLWHQYLLYQSAKKAGMLSFEPKLTLQQRKIAEEAMRMLQQAEKDAPSDVSSADKISMLRRRLTARIEAAHQADAEPDSEKTLKHVAFAREAVEDTLHHLQTYTRRKSLDDVFRDKSWPTSPLMHHHAIIVELFSIYAHSV